MNQKEQLAGTVMQKRSAKSKTITFLALACVLTALAACRSTQGLGSSDAKTKLQKQAQEIKSYWAEVNKAILDKSPVDASKPISATAYTAGGYAIIEEQCNAYFGSLIKRANGIEMSKADVVAAGTAVTTIQTLAKSATKEIGIAAATFGLAAVTLDNVQKYSIASEFPVETWNLVSRAMAAYRTSAPPSQVQGAIDAIDKVSGYAQLCTRPNIASLARQAIQTAKPADTNTKPPLFDPTDRVVILHEIERQLNTQADTLTEQQFIVLAAIADQNLPNPGVNLPKLVTMLPTAVGSAIVDSTNARTSVATSVGVFTELLVRKNPIYAAKKAELIASLLAAPPAFGVVPQAASPSGVDVTGRPVIEVNSR